jgi:hypothetical protein
MRPVLGDALLVNALPMVGEWILRNKKLFFWMDIREDEILEEY